MGQKVNPNSLRVGINKYWQSTWFEKKDYSNFLKEDHSIRSYIEKNYAIAGISSIIIERAAANLKIIIHTSRCSISETLIFYIKRHYLVTFPLVKHLLFEKPRYR